MVPSGLPAGGQVRCVSTISLPEGNGAPHVFYMEGRFSAGGTSLYCPPGLFELKRVLDHCAALQPALREADRENSFVAAQAELPDPRRSMNKTNLKY